MLSHLRHRRTLRRALSAMTTAAFLGAATPALAATSSISVTNNTANPEQAVPVDLTLSGTNGSAATAEVEAVVRPAGGLACQSSYGEDVSTLGSVDSVILAPGSQSAAAGTYSVPVDIRPSQPGSYQICAWLDGGSDGTDPLAAPGTVTLTARGPQVGPLAVSAPSDPAPHADFRIAYTVQTDQPLTLFSVLQPVGAG